MRWPELPWHQRALGAALLAAVRTLQLLPSPAAYGLAELVAPLVFALALLHDRRVAPRGRGMRRNLRIAFRDELDPARERRILWGWARHLCHLLVDVARLPRGRRDRGARADFAELERLRPWIERGHGLLCVSGHIGVWELLGHVPSLRGLPVTIVARPFAPAPLNDVLNALRRSGGQQVLEKRGVLWPLKKALDAGAVVGFLQDEDTRQRPVFAPFLGTLAATNPAAAFLQRSTGAPIAVVSCERVARERYRLRVWDVFETPGGDDPEAGERAVTERINAALSQAIRARPEQWLWNMRRFHTRPPGEVPGPDGLPPRA